ncbi:hypothetical protein ACGC1H_003491 [Rhizoctonia solani]|uniref:Uncharacterized protein n=1 Tax=Rhizoctonia solani TaxID=456999 RepID=A0A8H3AIS4_9AGAM|nr:unnamed protein product [Rhizoctonia solani]
MPHWTLKSTATKMLQNLSSNTPRERKGSIDVHVHTQRSCFVEPVTCDHRARLVAPYTLPPKYEKEISGGRPKPKPKPLKIRNGGDDENWTPCPDEMPKSGLQLVDRNRRRYGMMYYPEGVRDELRRAHTRSRSRSRSPRVKTQFSPSPTSSFCADQIVISSARHDKAVYDLEPPSWFSITSESGDPSRFSCSTSDEPPSGRVLSVQSAKSWETFSIPSVPSSPVDSVSDPPRDPRLPPADYLVYKDMYDDAMIKMHGKLPAEWVAYTHRHRPGPSRI